jgi:hypothetical protein
MRGDDANGGPIKYFYLVQRRRKPAEVSYVFLYSNIVASIALCIYPLYWEANISVG